MGKFQAALPFFETYSIPGYTFKTYLIHLEAEIEIGRPSERGLHVYVVTSTINTLFKISSSAAANCVFLCHCSPNKSLNYNSYRGVKVHLTKKKKKEKIIN